jgi:hypothetical protein
MMGDATDVAKYLPLQSKNFYSRAARRCSGISIIYLISAGL